MTTCRQHVVDDDDAGNAVANDDGDATAKDSANDCSVNGEGDAAGKDDNDADADRTGERPASNFIAAGEPADAGAQQPGMTGQVKEEILTRWGELGLRVRDGHVHFDPILLDEAEFANAAALTFTFAQVPYTYRRGLVTRLRILTAHGWADCPQRRFDPHGVQAVEAEIGL